MYAFYTDVVCRDLDWQVASTVQIFSMLKPAFSEVDNLTFEYSSNDVLSERRNEVDRTQWRDLLRSFSNVKTLQVDSELVDQLSRSLQLEHGELPMELLPELRELSYSDRGDSGGAFTAFIDARRIAGRPVTVIRR